MVLFSLNTYPLFRQYEVTSQFANRGFTEHTGNNKYTLYAAYRMQMEVTT